MVIIPDRLSNLISKGEVTDRYYNPGNLFEEVHIVMTNDDSPEESAVSRLVGTAELHIHNLTPGPSLFFKTAGWRPLLIRRFWRNQVLNLIDAVRPQLIRSHGAHLNAFAALIAKEAREIPYAVSLHNHPIADRRFSQTGWREKIAGHFEKRLRSDSLRGCDLAFAVYEPLMDYLRDIGVENPILAYNVINPRRMKVKMDYSVHSPLRLVSVGRQAPGKNPENILKAIASIEGVQLTLIGDGALHDQLKEKARSLRVEDRVDFVQALANDTLTQTLADYDMFIAQNNLLGIPKAFIEAFLAGMPVITNKREGIAVPELSRGICSLVDDTPAAYRQEIERLRHDHTAREALGRHARETAKMWEPEITEERYASAYRSLTGLT